MEIWRDGDGAVFVGAAQTLPLPGSPPPPLRPRKEQPGRPEYSRCHEPSPAGAHGESRTAAQQRVSRGHGRYMHLRPRDERRPREGGLVWPTTLRRRRRESPGRAPESKGARLL